MGTLSNIIVEPMEVNWGGSALGYTDGDIELGLNDEGVDVTAHQEGTKVLDMIRTGKTIDDITIMMKETEVAKIKYLIQQGGALTGSPEVAAWGTSKDFTAVSTQAAKLVLHPVVNAASNYTRDVAFWKAYPATIAPVFSGENVEMWAVTFKIYPDLSKVAAVRYAVFGDHTQVFS